VVFFQSNKLFGEISRRGEGSVIVAPMGYIRKEYGIPTRVETYLDRIILSFRKSFLAFYVYLLLI
jgi:hypothetical protein